MEWRLWDGDEPPFFTQPDFFKVHPRIAGDHQVGYWERQRLVADTVTYVHSYRSLNAITDLGCGDGTLLNSLHSRIPYVKMWGYDLGAQNLDHAVNHYGVDARFGNIISLDENIELAECVLITEVLEHLVDPHGFLDRLRARPEVKWIIATSPSAESDRWHYEHHAWAWDVRGFADLLEAGDGSWELFAQETAGSKDAVRFGPSGLTGHPSFQCVAVRRI